MRAHELIADEKKFCRSNFALNSAGHFTNPGINPRPLGQPEGSGKCEAVKWDLQGALIHCYDSETADRYRNIAMQLAIKRTRRVKYIEKDKAGNEQEMYREENYRNLAEFNDYAPHAEVVNLLKFVEV